MFLITSSNAKLGIFEINKSAVKGIDDIFSTSSLKNTEKMTALLSKQAKCGLFLR